MAFGNRSLRMKGRNKMERLAVTPREFAKMLGVSANHVYNLIASGQVRVTRLGRRLLIPRYELERLGLLPKENPAGAGGER